MAKRKKSVIKRGKSKKMDEKIDENKKKFNINKKTKIVLGIIAVCLVSFFVIHMMGGLKINGNVQGSENENGTSSPVQVAPAPTCSDGIQNQGERHVDCDGPCNACPPDCYDGILNQDETAVDCGGTICPACPTCTDKIQNQGERHIDCGGPCSACPPDCSDGIKNQNETGIDCGGICGACPTCTDKIQNQGEIGIDCGGPCSACPPSCSDSIQNQGEIGIDCGGPCSACVAAPVRPVITDAQRSTINQAVVSSPFIKDFPNNGIIALRFYDFFLGERIWQSDILIGKTGIVTSGTPDLVLIMHARYIAQLSGENMCDIINAANTNGEMWTESSLGTAKLLMKYSGMMKYKSCFGL